MERWLFDQKRRRLNKQCQREVEDQSLLSIIFRNDATMTNTISSEYNMFLHYITSAMMSILKNDDSHNSKYIPSDCFRKLSKLHFIL